jgi:hypothetical protein
MSQTYSAFRAPSNNSYLVVAVEDNLAHIFFPFLGIRGISGTLPLESQDKNTYLGEVSIDEDGTPNFESLLEVTGGN